MKVILTFLTLMLLCGITYGQKSSKTDAEKIANEIYKRNNYGKTTNLKEVIPLKTKNKENDDTLLYVVPFEESGFAIISGELAASPVLGYCFEGEYDETLMPPGLLYLIEKYKNEIEVLKEKNKNRPIRLTSFGKNI